MTDEVQPAEQPSLDLTTTIPGNRSQEFVLNQPGVINVADKGGAYPGCLAKTFDSAEHMNAYFRERVGLLVITTFPLDAGRIFCLISRQMNDDDLEEFAAYQDIIAAKMNEFREKKAEEKKLAREQAAAADKAAKEFMAQAKVSVQELAALRKAHEELKEKYNAIKKQLKGSK